MKQLNLRNNMKINVQIELNGTDCAEFLKGEANKNNIPVDGEIKAYVLSKKSNDWVLVDLEHVKFVYSK